MGTQSTAHPSACAAPHLPLLAKVFTGGTWPVHLVLIVGLIHWAGCWHAAAQHVSHHGLLLVMLLEAEVVVLRACCGGCCYPAPAWLLLLVLTVAVASQQHRARACMTAGLGEQA